MTDHIRIFHLLQRAHAALFRAADRGLVAQSGLRASQQGVLFALSQREGMTAGEVAALLSLGKSSLSGLLDRMEEKQLIRRGRDQQDGRVIRLFLTDAGRAAKEAGKLQTKRINQRLLDPFTAQEQEVIARFLRHVDAQADTIVNGTEPERKKAS